MALAGGVGAARFLEGLVRVVPPEEITVVVNTGDDAEFYGLYVSPDIDIVIHGNGMPGVQWRNTKGDITNAFDFPFDGPARFKLKLVRQAAARLEVPDEVPAAGAQLVRNFSFTWICRRPSPRLGRARRAFVPVCHPSAFLALTFSFRLSFVEK